MLSAVSLRRCALAFLFLGAAAGVHAAGEAPPPLPVSAYVAPADFVQASLSADGRYLATLAPLKGKRNLVVLDLETMKPRAVTGLTDFDVLRFNWVGSEFLVFTLGQLDTPTGPDQGNGGGLFAIRFDGTGFRKLSATVAEQSAKGSYRPLTFMRAVPGSNHEILALTPDQRTRRPDVHRIDLRSGERVSLTEDAPEDVEGWWLDNEGLPRLAVTVDTHGKAAAELEQVYLLRDSMGAPWREIARFKQADKGKWSSALGFAADNRNLIVNGRFGHDTAGLHLFDVEKKELGEALARHPRYDGSEARLLRDAENRVIGLKISDDTQQTIYFDADLARLQAAMEASFKGLAIDLQRSAANGKMLVTVWGDRHPHEYFIYEEATRTLKSVLRSRRNLDERHLVAMRPFMLKTRDGLEIPSYYFLPAHAKEGERLPTVVQIHGGPHVRADRWGSLSSYGVTEAQILASRGYAVVLPNFRITPGLGSKIYRAGMGEVGRKMSDDHEDAANWAVAQGFADPQRICISGASYGGYAALWASIRSADVFRCAVAGLAPSDLRRQNTSVLTDYVNGGESGINYWKQLIGVKGEDWAPADAVSPLLHAERSAMPLFLYSGGADRRIPIEQTNKMVSALKAAGKPPEFVMIKPEEGHGYGKQENRVELYEEMLKFLDRHIGNGYPATARPAQALQ